MKTAVQSASRVGAAVTAGIALLPYIEDFFITAYVVGALAAVWFVLRSRRYTLSLNDGAQIGFRGGFYGVLAASSIYDVVWQLFNYRLWEIRNADRIVALFADMARGAFSPSAWFLITLQIVIAAICAGVFGAPSGMLAVKIFQRRTAR